MALLNASTGQQLKDFLELYQDMLSLSRKEHLDATDKVRHARLVTKVDRLFTGFTSEERLEAVRLLVDNDLAPKSWLAIQSAVGGVFMKVTELDPIT